MNRILLALLCLFALPARADDDVSGISYNATTGSIQARTRANGTKQIQTTGGPLANLWMSAAGTNTSVGDCTTSTCTLTYNYGGGISSVTRSGTGVYSLALTGSFWSGPPICTIIDARGSARICVVANNPSTTAVPFSCLTSTAGAAVDTAFMITCMGPRS